MSGKTKPLENKIIKIIKHFELKKIFCFSLLFVSQGLPNTQKF
jgi:hypothetical protein